jgi:GT2 family glycosyltransferase
MNSTPEPVLCLWSTAAPSPERIATWRAMLPAGVRIVLAAPTTGSGAGWIECAGDPLSAVHAIAEANLNHDIVFAHLDARLNGDGWRRLVETAAVHTRVAVLSALSGAVPALDAFPGASAESADHCIAICRAWGEHALFPCDHWSPGLSYWRRTALSDAGKVRDAVLPESLTGCVLGDLYAPAPRAEGFPEEAPLPVRVLRARFASLANARGFDPGARPVVLHALHGWGGGAERFVRDLMQADRDRAHLVLVASGDPASKFHGVEYALHHDLDAPPLRVWPLAQTIADTVLRSPEYAAMLGQIRSEWNVRAVLVSSLIGHSLDVLRTGLPTAVCAHDYYPLWPALHADFDDAAADWSDEALRVAAPRQDSHSPLAPRESAHWIELRNAYVEALYAARATMVAPGAWVVANQRRISPKLEHLDWRVIAHGFSEWPNSPPEASVATDSSRPLLVLVLGRVQDGKGERLLNALLPILPDGIELVLLGAGATAMRWFGDDRVHVCMDYAHDELPAQIARIRPDLALIPASVSETWSYTLSEIWSLGLPVLATRIGSLARRISEGVDGLLVAPNAEAIAQRLRELRADRAPLLAQRPPPLPTLAQMAARWREALPALATNPLVVPLANPDRMRALAAELDAANARAQFAAQSDTVSAQQVEIERRGEWGHDLDRQLRGAQTTVAQLHEETQRLNEHASQLQGKLGEAHAFYERDTADLHRQRDVAIGQRDRLDAERTQLLASFSWQITKPFRWLRRGASGAFARLQFFFKRSGNALARTQSSLQRRGLSATVQRIGQELRGPADVIAPAPWLPENAPFAPFAVPRAETPVASIVVPAFNHFDHTLTCLRALAASGDATAFEVIVVDDASSDETEARLAEIEGIRVHRNAGNLGFIGSCNAGAAQARGDYLVFLNNDTAVQAGWLDALVRTFDAHPGAGLVGAKLVYPDGRLQEAGGIVFSDGSGWNYGRFEDPAAPAYNYMRDADYCSGAAIALPRALFERLGGFDAHYAPAYYEDTDLAMKVRAEGLRVLYQPASTVVHFEGVTSGTDEGSGIKAHQAVNREKFLERWKQQLAAHPAPDAGVRLACEHRAAHRVLVIDACTPMPDRDSGSLRMLNLLALLREEGCAVSFFADNLLHDGRYTEALQQLGVQVWWNPWIRDVPGWFAEHGAQFDTIVASRHYVASNYLALARRHAPKARFVFDTVDLHFLREQREAEHADDAALARTAQQTRERELELIRDSDLTLVVSPVERELLATEVPGAAVEVLSNVHRVAPVHTGFDQRRDLVFVGGFRHPPNVDAALWMANEIFPLVRAKREDIELHLIGSDVTEAVRELDAFPGVHVHGHVPDLDRYMDGCRIGLAPLRYGAGVKGKVNLSMAHGQPVVATPAAAEGMQLRDGVDVLEAADAQAFADAVLRLYDDRELWETLAAHGVENVERHFSFDAAREALRRLLG